jgi:hypothetical protein
LSTDSCAYDGLVRGRCEVEAKEERHTLLKVSRSISESAPRKISASGTPSYNPNSYPAESALVTSSNFDWSRGACEVGTSQHEVGGREKRRVYVPADNRNRDRNGLIKRDYGIGDEWGEGRRFEDLGIRVILAAHCPSDYSRITYHEYSQPCFYI